MWSGVLISNCKPAKRLQFEKEETGSEDKRLRAWRGDSFRRGRFRRASGGPIFSLAREKIGKKRVLGRVWCILRCDSGRNLIYRYYEHTYSPYGRFGTRRLLWCTKFVNSCDSISAVKTPFVQNLQGSTDSPQIPVKSGASCGRTESSATTEQMHRRRIAHKNSARISGRRWFYFAYSTAFVSRMTLTLIWPGYSSSDSIFLARSWASRIMLSSVTSSGLTMTRTSRPAWMA